LAVRNVLRMPCIADPQRSAMFWNPTCMTQEDAVEQSVKTRDRKPLFMAAGALGVAAIIGTAAALSGPTLVAGTPTAVQGLAAAASLPNSSGGGSGSTGRSGGQGYGGYGAQPYGGYGAQPYGGYGSGQGYGDSSGNAAAAAATQDQEVGVVDIDTVLSYAGAEAAGTGLVLTPDGQILTNNHVVQGSTSITVTVVSSGQTYRATVVGTDAKDDIAVLQLTDASGLTTANLGTSANVAVGDAVVGVGNAGGEGGTPSAAAGTVSALNQTITTQSDGVSDGETLSGLIETTANIESGDSGGPLFNASNQVVGIDTAAEVVSGQSANGYSIPIDTALGIAKQISSGQASDNIVIGYPAFLGVQLQSATAGTGSGRGRYGSGSSAGAASNGALIAGVVNGSPAAGAGLTAGDTIVGIDSTAVGSADALSSALTGHKPGDNVTVTWVDAAGSQHSASVTLAQGPAA